MSRSGPSGWKELRHVVGPMAPGPCLPLQCSRITSRRRILARDSSCWATRVWVFLSFFSHIHVALLTCPLSLVTNMKRITVQEVDDQVEDQLLVIAQVGMEGYFVAELPSTRRLLLDMAAVCQRLLGEDDRRVLNHLAAEFAAFLEGPSEEGEPPVHKLEIIFQSSQPENRFTLGTFLTLLPSVIKYFDRVILEWLASVDCLPPREDIDQVELMALTSALTTMGKTLTSLAKFHREPFLDQIRARSQFGQVIFSQNTQLGLLRIHDLVPSGSIWRNLLGGFLSVLFNSRYTKDSQFLAGMAFSSLLDAASSTPEILAERWLALFFPENSPLVRQSNFESYSPTSFSRLTACRGLVTIADQKTLMAPIVFFFSFTDRFVHAFFGKQNKILKSSLLF